MGPKPDPASGDIIFVGRLSPEKGAFVYAEAARRAKLRPTFVGDGPIAGEIARRYPEARLLGWQDAEGVRSAMRAARALVFPSLWYEGQPLTVLEAKGLGVPVIVSDACAGREEVEDGVTGLWFKSQDVGDLTRALEHHARRRTRRRHVARRLRRVLAPAADARPSRRAHHGGLRPDAGRRETRPEARQAATLAAAKMPIREAPRIPRRQIQA